MDDYVALCSDMGRVLFWTDYRKLSGKKKEADFVETTQGNFSRNSTLYLFCSLLYVFRVRSGKFRSDCHVLIPEHIKVDRDLLSMAKKLKLVQTGAGYDNVDIDACTQLGIWVANAAGVNAQAVAEHVMALMLSYYKNIPYLDSFMKTRIDEKQLDYTGNELKSIQKDEECRTFYQYGPWWDCQ